MDVDALPSAGFPPREEEPMVVPDGDGPGDDVAVPEPGVMEGYPQVHPNPAVGAAATPEEVLAAVESFSAMIAETFPGPPLPDFSDHVTPAPVDGVEGVAAAFAEESVPEGEPASSSGAEITAPDSVVATPEVPVEAAPAPEVLCTQDEQDAA